MTREPTAEVSQFLERAREHEDAIRRARLAEAEAIALRDEALARAKDSGASYGELAQALGRSRQTIVTAVRQGLKRLSALRPTITVDINLAHRSDKRPEKQRLFEQHREIARVISSDPEHSLHVASENLVRLRAKVRGDAGAAWLQEWDAAIRSGPDAVVHLALRDDDHGDSLRQVTPFTGLISEQARLGALERARAPR